MKKLIAVILFTLSSWASFAQVMDSEQIKDVTAFIRAVKRHDPAAIASKIHFPFSRQYPIPDIKSKKEFVKRYREVFDDSLVGIISKSDPIEDWSEVGWRGIMLGNGSVWLNDEGVLIAVNYQSKFEKKLIAKLIAEEKNTLHPSVSNFIRPVLLLRTKNYLVRVDETGEYQYRYASWRSNKKMSEKPDLIIENGAYIPEGSGGNHRYEFKNSNYVYHCEVIYIGADDSPPARLVVYKGEDEILSQRAEIIRR